MSNPAPELAQIVWGGLALPHPAAPAQHDFAVCINGGRIADAGPRVQVLARWPQVPVLGGDDLLLCAGFVNSHDHGRGLGTLPLGVPDDLLEVWLPGLAVLPPIDPYLLALVEGANLLRSGVTATAHSHNPSSWADLAAESHAALHGYRTAGIRVAFHPPFVDQNPLVYAGRAAFLESLPPTLRTQAATFLQPPPLSRDDYLALCTELFATYHDPEHHLAHIQISPAGGQWCSDDLILAACEWAGIRGTRVQMHLLETRYQALYAQRTWGKSFVRHLAEIGALGPWLTLAHMVWVEEDDLPLLAGRGVAVAHNPSSNLRLRSGVAPLPALLAAGLPLGIGLDGCALDDDQDYLRELRLAWTLANRPGAASPTVTPAEILHLGTVGGARATFGPSAELGTLAAGALADLVLLDRRGVEGIWAAPQIEPAALLLRRGRRDHVRHVLVGGRWVVRDGRTTALDEQALHAEIREGLQHWAASQDPAQAAGAAAARTLAESIRRFYALWDQ
jgi:cytosine/adenosine deaminase-related metal-dependent hydrolase